MFGVVVVGAPGVVAEGQPTDGEDQARGHSGHPVVDTIPSVAGSAVRADPVRDEVQLGAAPVGVVATPAVDGLHHTGVRGIGPAGEDGDVALPSEC